MRFKSVFGKIGKGILMGALKTGRFLGKLSDIPGAKSVMTMVPIAGPILSTAAAISGKADKLFPHWPGAKRKEWVKAQTAKDLRKVGHEEKYLEELVALAFLVSRQIAGVIEVQEAKAKAKPKATGDDDKKPDKKPNNPKSGEPKKR